MGLHCNYSGEFSLIAEKIRHQIRPLRPTLPFEYVRKLNLVVLDQKLIEACYHGV